jgi:hypothetical protein
VVVWTAVAVAAVAFADTIVNLVGRLFSARIGEGA